MRFDEIRNISRFTILCESCFKVQKLNMESLNQQNDEEERYKAACVCMQ